MDTNKDNCYELFEYFFHLCDNKTEKRISLHLISKIILTTDNLNEIGQNLINI